MYCTKKNIWLAAALVMLAALMVLSAEAAESARAALLLCAETIIPTLFPFFVLSILLNRLGLPELLGKLFARVAGRLFGVSGMGASALFVGLTGGYPMGAAYIADMVSGGKLDRREGERLLRFCNNSGPAFIIGAVGVGAFRSAEIGLFLYGIHILSAVLTGILFRKGGRDASADCSPPSEEEALAAALPDAVKAAVAAVANVCGFVVIFSVLVALPEHGGAFSRLCLALGLRTGLGADWFRALFTGLFELGNGVGKLKYLCPSPHVLALSAFLLGFGGLSVQLQTAAVISHADMKSAPHFTGRIVSGLIAFLLAFLFASVC